LAFSVAAGLFIRAHRTGPGAGKETDSSRRFRKR
jgi:hypothetical protein